jgi:mono/diheme cytochrome c family protein
MRPFTLCFVLATGLGSIGCGSNLPDVDCSGDIPQFADVAALQKCSTCHSSQRNGSARNGAPASVNYDTESAARSKADDAASEVNGGDMPPKGSGVTLSDAEKQALYKWALCK